MRIKYLSVCLSVSHSISLLMIKTLTLHKGAAKTTMLASIPHGQSDTKA